jgi:hypothetical protein
MNRSHSFGSFLYRKRIASSPFGVLVPSSTSQNSLRIVAMVFWLMRLRVANALIRSSPCVGQVPPAKYRHPDAG